MTPKQELNRLLQQIQNTASKRMAQYGESSTVVDYANEITSKFIARANTAITQYDEPPKELVESLKKEARSIKGKLEPRKFEREVIKRNKLYAIRHEPSTLGVTAHWRYTDVMEQTAKGSRDSVRGMDSQEVFEAAEILVDAGITRMWTRKNMEEALARHRAKLKPEDVFGKKKWFDKDKQDEGLS